ncbi:MAG: hypothetical protein HRT41_02185 [Campylobacteraceae bacterium]|nr:hypothetical protein [Campylobacteraceae bacterium]
MKTKNYLEKLRKIDTKVLAETMNINSCMARKYKREPWKYDPPTTKAIAVSVNHNIPVLFWKDIKSFITNHTESVTKNNEVLEVQKNKN